MHRARFSSDADRIRAGRRRFVAVACFAVTALLAVPLSLLLQRVFSDQHTHLAAASAIMGVLSGLVQAMGLFRWTFLVPSLAAQYNADAATPATRDAVAVVFNAFHQYIGVAVGEHLMVYERMDGTLGLLEDYKGDENPKYYMDKLYKFANRLEEAVGDTFDSLIPKPTAQGLPKKVQETLDLFG